MAPFWERFARVFDLARPPAADYANGLCQPASPRPLPVRWGVLVALLVACLIPRAWSAWRFDVLWADSVVYLRITEALERNDFDAAFGSLGLNPYPVILMWLRRTGIDWTVIGEWWSVAMTTLAVLPLYAWIRRQFDDQVALIGCLLYAVHPTLVGASPLIIRDPTYWFLFSLSLYLTWRAVTEARIRFFVGAGFAVALAAYTRAEGWLLWVPVLLWTCLRLRWAPGRRVRLAVGTALCLAVLPACVVLVNVTWLKGHSRWELGRLSLFPMVWSWVCSCGEPLFGSVALGDEPSKAGPGAVPSDSPEAGIERAPAPPATRRVDTTPSGWTHGRKVALRIAKSFTYPYGLLILIGLWRWRRVFLHSDQQVLFLQNGLLFLSIWAYQSASSGIDIRYYLTILIVGLPYVALGLLQTIDWGARLARRCWTPAPWQRPAVAYGLVAALVLLGLPEMTPSAYPVMAQQTSLGQWVLRQRGPGRLIVGPPGALDLMAYSARGRGEPLPRRIDGDVTPVVDQLRNQGPDVVFLWDDLDCTEVFAMRSRIFAECRKLGYEGVPPEQLPPSCRGAFVFFKGRPGADPPGTASRDGSPLR